MPNFRVIPVLDIMDSIAVHAKKGERANYQPINLKLIRSTNPIEIVDYLKFECKFEEFYLADLDAITKYKPNFEILLEILDVPDIRVMIDPGIRNKGDLLKFSEFKLNKLILGLETIENVDVIKESLEIFGHSKIIVSIDMYREKIISNVSRLGAQNPLQVVKEIEDVGVKEVILLDLFRVGQKIGGIPPLSTEIQNKFNGTVLIGGGIKNYQDLLMYKDREFSGVLIATALYDGSIDVEKVKKINLT
jgi:phosphoribosylformimino-5-aminoimidazole carboxamide ribotide isomerase